MTVAILPEKPGYEVIIQEMGVRIRPNTVLGGALRIENLFRDGYAAILSEPLYGGP